MTAQQGTSSGSASTSSQMREEVSEDASRLKDTAEQRARQEAETRKGQAAQVAGSASSAFDTAASELERDDNAPDWLSSAMRQAAGSIDRVASEMEGRDVNEIGQQVARFARTNPGSFLAASAAAGFAAARVLRAGAEHRQQDERSQAYGSYRGVGDGDTARSGANSTPYGSTAAGSTTTGGTSASLQTAEGTTK